MSKKKITYTAPELAAMLQNTPPGRDITAADIEQDIDEGLPVTDDGKIDLVHYATWLLIKHGYGTRRVKKKRRRN